MKTKRSRIQHVLQVVRSDNVHKIEHLIDEIHALYVRTGEMEEDEFPNLLLDVGYEAATTGAISTLHWLIIKQRFKISKGNTWRFLWITTFLRIFHEANDDAAMLMFDVGQPGGNWDIMSVGRRIDCMRYDLPEDSFYVYRDFYAPLLHLHDKISKAKKTLERTRFRGCFRRWALNEELLAPAYQPPTAKAAGGAAFQREEVACEFVRV